MLGKKLVVKKNARIMKVCNMQVQEVKEAFLTQRKRRKIEELLQVLNWIVFGLIVCSVSCTSNLKASVLGKS